MKNIEKNKKENPAKNANLLSLIFLWYTRDIFWKSNRRDLKLNDIYNPLEPDESEKLGDRLEKEWQKELKKTNKSKLKHGSDNEKKWYKPSLVKAIFRMFFWPNVGLIILNVLNVALNLVHPIIQGRIVNHFDHKHDVSIDQARDDALLEATLMILVKFGCIVTLHQSIRYSRCLGMRARIACSSLLYRKSLRLNKSITDKSAAGQIINLMSNDVSRFDMLFYFLNYVWITPIQLICVVVATWDYIGGPILIGIVVLLIVGIPLHATVTITSKILRLKIARLSDKRIQLIGELISGIQVIKLYAWEKPFEKIVNATRLSELNKITLISYVRNILFSSTLYMQRIAVFTGLVFFVLSENMLTPGLSFDVVTMINVIQLHVLFTMPNGLFCLGEASVTVKRIEEFLMLDEKNDESTSNLVSVQFKNSSEDKAVILDNVENTPKIESKISDAPVEVNFDRVSANWIPDQLPPTLHELTFKVEAGSLCALAGPVGSGKTAVLNLLLRELSLGGGTVIIQNESQSSNNNSQMRGFHVKIPNLRISYASQNAWLFSGTVRENILFGLPHDPYKYNQVIEACALRQDFKQFSKGDMTIVGERGASLSGGQKARINLARAVYRDADLYLLDDPLSAVDPQVARHLFEKCILEYLAGKTRILVMHQLQFLQRVDSILFLERGNLKYYGPFQNIADYDSKIINIIDKIKVDSEKRSSTESLDDNLEIAENVNLLESSKESDINRPSPIEESYPKYNYFNLFLKYLKVGSSYCFLSFYALVLILTLIASMATDYWLGYWNNVEDKRRNLHNSTMFPNITKGNSSVDTSYTSKNDEELLDTNQCIYIYAAVLAACTFLSLYRNILLTKICMSASKCLHEMMFNNLLQFPMKFFNNNPAGQILNRFSKDTGSMDEVLSKYLVEVVQIAFTILGILILISISSPSMSLPIVAMMIMIYYVTHIYLNAAQKIKRIEAAVKSPIFSHTSTTLDGLTTIRSSGRNNEKRLTKEFDRHQNQHTGAWYLMIVTNTAFGFVVDFIMLILNALVAYTFILFSFESVSGSTVGLALSQVSFMIGMVQYGSRVCTDFIIELTSVERIMQYIKLPKEHSPTPPVDLPQNWPQNGHTILNKVSMRYEENLPYALKNLTTTIEPGWKVGIVGRTGAGKSSIISALFRLCGYNLEGQIIIDGVNTDEVKLHDLRSRISILPQEPVLFSQTLRYNLDPFGQLDDSVLLDALREVELYNLSLDQQVSEKGSNFSIGQRQLICLARAIIRQNKILVLDEATANIDSHTDTIIQNTIRKKFENCTVLTIAHRLNTIIDSDRIMVMDNGSIAEFGSPHELLENNPEGNFSKMVLETGKVMSQKLKKLAKDSYDRKIQQDKSTSESYNSRL